MKDIFFKFIKKKYSKKEFILKYIGKFYYVLFMGSFIVDEYNCKGLGMIFLFNFRGELDKFNDGFLKGINYYYYCYYKLGSDLVVML